MVFGRSVWNSPPAGHGRSRSRSSTPPAPPPHPAPAAKRAAERGYNKITIANADPHHEEGGSARHMLKYIDSSVERFLTRALSGEGRRPMVPLNISYQDQGGRLQRFAA